MAAKLTLHPPRRPSRYLILTEGEGLTVGREPDCGLVVEDSRVSKRHAELRPADGGWRVVDLGSKNGTTVNGLATTDHALADGDWVSFGGLIARFEVVSADEVEALRSERMARLQTSMTLRRRLVADDDPLDTLQGLLGSALEVVGADRGFVLTVAPNGRIHAEVSIGLETDDVASDAFQGSLGAVRHVAETGQALVLHDVGAHAAIGTRPSVVTQRIGALACLPLRHERDVLGLLYLDRRSAHAPFTELDLEILSALTEHVAVLLAGVRLDRRLRELAKRAAGAPATEALQARLEELPHAGAPTDPELRGGSPRPR